MKLRNLAFLLHIFGFSACVVNVKRNTLFETSTASEIVTEYRVKLRAFELKTRRYFQNLSLCSVVTCRKRQKEL